MNLDTKIPPPIVTIIILTIIYLFDLKEYYLNTDVISVIMLFIGIIFIISAVVQFVNRKTTVNPTKPHKTTSLVITGAYKITRNPMYLGMLSIIISFAFYKSSIISLILIPFFIFYINKFQIEPEEFEMRKKFGKEYEDYCKKVDRWI
jgi:protein-S-isoprenylcysteine O-methyltransferase Ste14